MRVPFKTAFCFGLAMGVLAIIRPARAAPFQNGDFELPVLAPGVAVPLNYVYADTDNPITIPGWTSTESDIFPTFQNFIFSTGFDHVPDGNQALAFNGDGETTTTLSQTFDTQPGQTYLVSFLLTTQSIGANSGTVPPILQATLQVQATDNPLQSFLAPMVPDVNGVFRVLNDAYVFSATADSTTLTFSNGDGSTPSPILDDVQVTAVPEPAIGCVVLGVFALLLARVRRTVRRAA